MVYQDILKKRRTEVDFINGLVVKKGREAGVPTPFNEAMTSVIKQIELGKAEPDVTNASRFPTK
jgi:2-dehydropantoate 2-reductase